MIGSYKLVTLVIVALVSLSGCLSRSNVMPGEKKSISLDDYPTASPPSFCHGLDCPSYTVTDSFDDIELRKYTTGTWVSTNVSDFKYKKAVSIGFMRLFKYISGQNELGSKIEMTAPVKVKMIPSQGPFCENFFVISFFVSAEFQGKPPAPTNPEVYVEQVDATDYFVVQYGGFSKEEDSVTRAKDMVASLDSRGYSYEASYFFFAGYDSPFRLIGRHNEVWIESKPQSYHMNNTVDGRSA